MRIITTVIALLSATALASAQILSTDGFGRYRVDNFLTSPTYSTGTWGASSTTIGGTPGGNAANTWMQVLQFNATGVESSLNSSPTITLTLSNFDLGGATSFTIYGHAAGADNLAGSAGKCRHGQSGLIDPDGGGDSRTGHLCNALRRSCAGLGHVATPSGQDRLIFNLPAISSKLAPSASGGGQFFC